ncbi:hypothetical protein P691DRAFT_731241 [Macrolepiota fuliginosa MF-IS2]|uniref:Uncharacterized protein n=1 Tax=Macrolepiota fuliginosa MF-IS2 TaxID=1400762 RepID=A0A9P5X9Z1_9AGAR|nr:hypothetical protein P691DRAFT_731241 [Macrolepiota fuliginosa MF-IS2]
MQFKFLLYLASAYAVVFASTTQDVLDGLAAVQSSAATLDNAINAFSNSGGSLPAALAIHSSVETTKSIIDKATGVAGAVNPRPVSVADWNLIYGIVNDINPIVKDALVVVAAQKPILDALPLDGVPGLVLQDLQNLYTSTVTLENALIGLTPSEMLDKANGAKSEIEAAFAAATAAFS